MPLALLFTLLLLVLAPPSDLWAQEQRQSLQVAPLDKPAYLSGALYLRDKPHEISGAQSPDVQVVQSAYASNQNVSDEFFVEIPGEVAAEPSTSTNTNYGTLANGNPYLIITPPPAPVLSNPAPSAPAYTPVPTTTVSMSGGNCYQQLQSLGAKFERLEPFRKSNGCGIPDPVSLQSVNGIVISPAAKLSCSYALDFAKWVGGDLNGIVQAASGSPIEKIKNLSSYRCTSRAKGKLSYHATGQAFDFGGMTTRDGTNFSILNDWGKHLDRARTAPMINAGARQKTRPAFKPDSKVDPISRIKRDVLLIVADNACTKFNLVLSPHSNKDHDNHLHLDMGDWTQCEI